MNNPHPGIRYPSVPTWTSPRILLALLALVAPAATVSATPATVGRQAKEIEVHWKKEAYAREALPAELGAAPRAAVEQWAVWATEHEYRMELSEDGRVLLLLRTKRHPKKEVALMEETLAMFDELLPAPPRAESGAPAPTSEAGGPAAARTEPEEPWQWIQVGATPDTQTIVLVGARTQADYEAAVDVVAATESYLGSWAPTGKRAAGFVLERPLAGAWLQGGGDLEEHDPHNELVHRLARLLTLRRFGQQPWWLTMGLAWHFEIEIRGDVYCFPYRTGFVGRSEHGSWPSKLKAVAKKAGDEIEVQQLAGWERGRWSDDDAVLAWGTALYLARRHPEDVSGILEDFRTLYNAKGIDRRTDGTWRVNVEYTPSSEDQEDVLRWHLGDDFAAEMREAFAKKGARFGARRP